MLVKELQEIAFYSLDLDKKIEIKRQGRPLPDVKIVQVANGQNREFRRVFKKELYSKNDWICGCSETNRLYCFPCLLFFKGDAVWARRGVNDLNHLRRKMQKHENSQSHINSQIELKLLGKVNIRQQMDSAYRLNIERHNEQVLTNRYILSRKIQGIQFCGAFELALRGHDETGDSLNPAVFKGLVNFSAELDEALKVHIEEAEAFKGTSKTIKNELLECMLQVCRDHIKTEIRNARFVSVIADETTDVSSLFQMVVVFRYVLPDGTPVERFWGFLNPLDHDAANLSDSIKSIITEVIGENEPHKLISQSYDGASVMSGRYSGVQTLIKRDFQYAHHIHCYAHHLDLILSQAAKQNDEVRIFFANLNSITDFFSDSPQRVAVLDEVVGQKAPWASATRWNFKSRPVIMVYENREALIQCIEEIEKKSLQDDTIQKASGNLLMLQDPKFVFWLSVFYKLMPHSDILYSQLQKTKSVPKEIREAVRNFEEAIQKERDSIGELAEEIISANLGKQRKRKAGDPDISKSVAAKEVCDAVLVHVRERFTFTNHLHASMLFMAENFEDFEKRFPLEYLNAAFEAYPFLDKERLQTELSVIYKRNDFRNVSGAVALLKCIIHNNLEDTFSATLTLLQLVVTIPMTTAEPERCFSTLKRIKTFLKSTMEEERLTALAMLATEKSLYCGMTNFSELVINKFAEGEDRRTDFILKQVT